LFSYTIEAALKSYMLGRIVVSTEDKEIADIAKGYGVEVVKRPKKLAQDKTLIQPVMMQVLKYLEEKEDYKPYGIALLNPTSPLRTTEDIDNALRKFAIGSLDSVFTVYGCRMCLWKIDEKDRIVASYDFINKKRRQDMPQEYCENGAVYVFKRDYFLSTGRFIGGKLHWSIMPRANSVDINNLLDFTIAEALLKYINENLANQPEIQSL
jgi:CMP-N,N'-diacetyllegionaminic acid synthase